MIRIAELTCETLRENLVAYLKDELEAQARVATALHLQTCDRCRAESESLAKTLEASSRVAHDAPTVRLVNSILQEAFQLGASDIHIEPCRHEMRVRFRVDGVLHEKMKTPIAVHQPVINCIKLMSDMNLAECRLPQDGRIHVRWRGRDFDLRVSTFPFRHGEKAALRILEPSAALVTLDRTGLSPDQEQRIQDLLRRPNGLLLVAGPTGCGKSTVAYSMLQELDKDALNIVTVEDPVEYQFEGIVQTHVNREAGLTYPVAVRALLERDPDVIFVGELQDKETTEAALDAVRTGHLVLSIMHASDAVGAVARLQGFGLDAGSLSAALVGLVSLRLVRKVCGNCKQPAQPPTEALRSLGYEPHISAQFYKGAGCEECRRTGYRGRVGALEVLEVEESFAKVVAEGAGETALFKAAIEAGMQSIEQSAARLVCEGITTAEEALRVTTDLRERRGE